MSKRIFTIALIILGLSKYGAAQTEISSDRPQEKNLRISAFPVLFYLPETGLGYGGVAVSTFRLKNEKFESRPSSVQVGISLTSKNQFLLYIPYEIYKDDEKWRFLGELGFYKYFYNFYGLGANTPECNFEIYDISFPRLRVSALREIMPFLSLGINYELDIFYDLRIREGGILEQTQIEGKDNGGTLSNVGLKLIFDTRDNIFAPTKGLYLQADIFTSVSALGSDFDYNKYSFDFRFYKQIIGQHIIAFNSFLGSNSSGAPLFELYYIGSKRTRGFNDRRFQNFNELSFVTEYRFPVKNRVSGVAFASLGTVAQSLDGLGYSRYHLSAGLGARYVMNKVEGTRIRADLAFSPEGSNFYFTVQEAF